MKLSQDKIQKLECFLERIKADTYPEPPSELHTVITKKLLKQFLQKYPLAPASKVLDVGCGQGVALELFRNHGFDPVGITLNDTDVSVCQKKGFMVYEMDQSFLDFADGEFDFVWCRHCLEHSIFPYFTLNEMVRVLKSTGYLYVEVPAPDTAGRHQTNPNHYSVFGKTLWQELMLRSGAQIMEALDINFQIAAGPDTYWAFILRKP
jgi:SAM-dependent methyltransferase